MIGLLGGSFDPVHNGHLIVGQVASETLGLEELRFLPAREQPFKQGRHGASAVDRAAMLQLAIAGMPRLSIEALELTRPGPSYTVDTLRSLRSREPGAEFALLLGADAAADLPAWHEAGDVPTLARVIVFARPGSAIPKLAAIGGTVTVPAIDISATEIRRRVREGLTIRSWVPDAVAEYIASHRLYLDPE